MKKILTALFLIIALNLYSINNIISFPQNNCTVATQHTIIDQINITVNGSVIKKTDNNQFWGSSGGASDILLEDGDFITYQVLENKAVMVGLSEVNDNAHYNTIDHALYTRYDNKLYVWENGIPANSNSVLGSFDETSTLKISVENRVVKYFVDNTLIYTSPNLITINGKIMVDFSMYSIGSEIKNLEIHTGCNTDSDNDGVDDSVDVCPGFDDNIDTDNDGIPDGCDSDCSTSYNIIDQTSININNLTISKTTGNQAWGTSGGATNIKLTDGDFITYQALTDKSVMVGLSEVNDDAHYNTIDYAIYNRFDSKLYVWENGIPANSNSILASFEPDSYMKILFKNNTIKYFVDNLLFYTSTISTPNNTELLVDFSLYHIGAEIKNLTLHKCNYTPTPTTSLKAEKVFEVKKPFYVFPSVASNTLSSSISGDITIKDISGKTVKTLKNVKKNTEFSINKLTQGMYFIFLNNNFKIYSSKFLKE